MELIFFWSNKIPPFDDCQLNLSGRFEVSFTKNEERKEIKLEITENLSYPNSLFGQSILNITAFIGKNGTGKTNILQFVTEVLSGNSSWFEHENYLAIYFSEDEKTFLHRHNMHTHISNDNFINNTPLRGASNYQIQFSVPHGYNTELSNPPTRTKTIFYSPLFNNEFLFGSEPGKIIDLTPEFLINADHNKAASPESILSVHKSKNIERQLNFVFQYEGIPEVTQRFPLPSEMTIESIEQEHHDMDWDHNLNYSSRLIREFFLGGRQDNSDDNKKIIIKNIYSARNVIDSAEMGSPSSLEVFRKKTGLFFLLDFVHNFFNALNSSNNWLDDDIGVTTSNLQYLEPWDAFKKFLVLQQWTNEEQRAIILRFFQKLNDFIFSSSTNVDFNYDRKVYSADLMQVYELLQLQRSYQESLLSHDIYSDRRDLISFNWRRISSGEKAFINFFSRLHYAKESIEAKEEPNNIGLIYLIIDEGEVGFHPEWQREYLDLIINIIPQIFPSKKIQTILSSHSPFLVSDLFKENIIFLNRDGNGRAIIDKGVARERTFAGNIHTILSDSFFMENGLIGEFGKKKIKEIISQITSKNLERKNEIIKVINGVGEPIIKQKLEDLFLQHFDHKITQTDREERIRELQNELAKLRGESPEN